MADHLPDTPDMSVTYCPLCEPERDPFEILPGGKVLVEKRCGTHDPERKGSEDAVVSVSDAYLPSSGEADGRVSNTEACNIVHRGRRRKKRA